MPKRFLFYIVLLYSLSAQAQSRQVENLVFEGAGIRGIAYSGAITELEQQNLLGQVKRIGGTSAGAITAMMLALGYNAQEITSIVSATNFRKFNDGKFLFIGGLYRVRNYFGWYRGNKVEYWLQNIIKQKTGNADITFQELKEKGFKDLYVTGTNLTDQKLTLFSYEHFPAMKIKDAVRISMSIPLYFEAVFMDSTGKVYSHPKSKKGLKVMADGGFTGNFPIRLFDSTKYVDSSHINQFSPNPFTLGFRIDNEVQVTYDLQGKGLAAMPITSVKQYLGAFYGMVIENLNRQLLTEDDWKRTISISDGGIGPRIKKLSDKEVLLLSSNGRKATALYLHEK